MLPKMTLWSPRNRERFSRGPTSRLECLGWRSSQFGSTGRWASSGCLGPSTLGSRELQLRIRSYFHGRCRFHPFGSRAGRTGANRSCAVEAPRAPDPHAATLYVAGVTTTGAVKLTFRHRTSFSHPMWDTQFHMRIKIRETLIKSKLELTLL